MPLCIFFWAEKGASCQGHCVKSRLYKGQSNDFQCMDMSWTLHTTQRQCHKTENPSGHFHLQDSKIYEDSTKALNFGVEVRII